MHGRQLSQDLPLKGPEHEFTRMCMGVIRMWQVVVDVGASHLVHSASEDCMLLSYNVKTGRRYNIHTV
jgi:hypothetical protein